MPLGCALRHFLALISVWPADANPVFLAVAAVVFASHQIRSRRTSHAYAPSVKQLPRSILNSDRTAELTHLMRD